MDNEPTLTINSHGDNFWWLNGELHRVDGPAIEFSNGTKQWYLHGKIHRVDGPADEWASGNKFWYLEGKPHRVDGPAFEYTNGDKEWWLNDNDYEFERWLEVNTYISEEEKLMLKLQYG
jgi:hypothetical protein